MIDITSLLRWIKTTQSYWLLLIFYSLLTESSLVEEKDDLHITFRRIARTVLDQSLQKYFAFKDNLVLQNNEKALYESVKKCIKNINFSYGGIDRYPHLDEVDISVSNPQLDKICVLLEQTFCGRNEFTSFIERGTTFSPGYDFFFVCPAPAAVLKDFYSTLLNATNFAINEVLRNKNLKQVHSTRTLSIKKNGDKLTSLGLELQRKLKENYSTAKQGEVMLSLHKFGIENAEQLTEAGVKLVVYETFGKQSFVSEVRKGILMAPFLEPVKSEIVYKLYSGGVISEDVILKKLNDIWNGERDGLKMTRLHLFGVKYARTLEKIQLSRITKQITEADALAVELYKGIRLARYFRCKKTEDDE